MMEDETTEEELKEVEERDEKIDLKPKGKDQGLKASIHAAAAEPEETERIEVKAAEEEGKRLEREKAVKEKEEKSKEAEQEDHVEDIEDDEEQEGFQWDSIKNTTFGGRQAAELMLILRGAMRRAETDQNNGKQGESRRRKQWNCMRRIYHIAREMINNGHAEDGQDWKKIGETWKMWGEVGDQWRWLQIDDMAKEGMLNLRDGWRVTKLKLEEDIQLGLRQVLREVKCLKVAGGFATEEEKAIALKEKREIEKKNVEEIKKRGQIAAVVKVWNKANKEKEEEERVAAEVVKAEAGEKARQERLEERKKITKELRLRSV